MDAKISPAAGVQERLDALGARSGCVRLDARRYELTETVRVDAPCTRLCGEVWSYSADPNGVFESHYGTQLRLLSDIPALSVGITHTAEGCVLEHFGVQGNITGMDTRPLFGSSGPTGGCGVLFAHQRVDQAELSKLTFCGLGSAIKAERGAEIDACRFDRLNTDGCAVGVWFAPGAAYYPMFTAGLYADNPYYAFYADGTGIQMHHLELRNNLFIRSGGAFSGGWEPAAVCWQNVSGGIIRDNVFDCPGLFWYYPPDADKNAQRQPHQRQTTALFVRGDGNVISGNTFTNSSAACIHVIGNDNVLLNNICDADVILEGRGNQAVGTVFTKPEARLIVREA